MSYNVRFESIIRRDGFIDSLHTQRGLFYTCSEGKSLFDHLCNSLSGSELINSTLKTRVLIKAESSKRSIVI